MKKNILKFLNKIFNCRKKLLLSLFLLSIISSVVFLALLGGVGPSQHNVPGTDYSNCYRPAALSMLDSGKIYLEKGNHICSPPGYPFFLIGSIILSRLTGIDELQLILILNILMIALAACLFFLMVDSLFGRKVSIISSLLWVSYPFSLWFLKNPNSEIPFIAFLFLGLWLFLSTLKKRNYGFLFFAGAIFGILALIRPIALFLPLLFSLVSFSLMKEGDLRKRISFSLLFLTGGLIPVFLWEVAIVSLTGQFILLSSSGPQAVIDGLTFASRTGAGGDKVLVSGDVSLFMDRVRGADLQNGGQLFGFLKNELIQNPMTVIKMMGWKLIRAWYATSQMWWEGKILLVQLPYLLSGLFGMIYLFRKKEKIWQAFFLLFLIFYFWAMTMVALSILRYMVPAMAFLIVFSAITIGLIVDYFLKKNKPEEK